MSQDKLMDALGFTADDLDANRAGYMTAGQKELLKVGRLEAGAKYALIALLFCVILIAGLLTLSSGNENTIYVVMGFGIFGLIAIGVIVVAVMEGRNFTLDIREGQASMVTGPFTLAALKAGRDSTHYKIKIHDLVFDISESAWQKLHSITDRATVQGKKKVTSFDDGNFYCLYFTPRTKRILSIERTDKYRQSTSESVAE